MSWCRRSALPTLGALSTVLTVACGGDAFEAAPPNGPESASAAPEGDEATASPGSPQGTEAPDAGGSTTAELDDPTNAGACPDLRVDLAAAVLTAVDRLDADRCEEPADCRGLAVQSPCGGSCNIVVGLDDGGTVDEVQADVARWIGERCPANCTDPVAPCVADTLNVACVGGRCVPR